MCKVSQILLVPPVDDETIQPADWFETPGDVELEIGCGKGGFLLRRAQQHPEKRLVGIEWANKICHYAADRMARWGVTNVRLLRTDADHFVKVHLAASCLSALHIYHPDPWPKKRHHKRRLIQSAFVEAAVRSLKPGARWAVQTDHAEYFEQIRACLLSRPELHEACFDDSEFGVESNSTGTNYEVKYLREARPIYRLAVVRG